MQTVTALAQETTTAAVVYTCPPCGAGCDSLTFDKAGDCPHCSMPLQVTGANEQGLLEKPLHIAFYLQDGVEVLDFAGPMEVFAYAGFEVFTVSKTKEPIKSQGILTILPDYSIEDAPQADILAFFGGNAGEPASDTAVIAWVHKQTNIQQYFSVCTGAFVLGSSGLLDNQTVTTFHQSLTNLKKAVPKARVLRDVRYVDNGRIITTAGISAGIDGALHLVAKLQGPIRALQVADYMEYDKWTPGEGLLLKEASQEQLSYKAPTKKELIMYEGHYHNTEEGNFHLVYFPEKNRLYALFGQERIPVYYEAPGKFRTTKNEVVTFLFDTKGKATGFQIGDRPTRYKRISSQVAAQVREQLTAGREVQ